MGILDLLLPFALGFITSFIGSIPFGSINLAVVRISIRENISSAFHFIIGATIAELFYSYISIHFSGFLISIPKLEFYIKVVTIPIFLFLGGIYFFSKPKPEHSVSELEYKNDFLQGLTIGFLNPLQIPFWLAYGTYFLSVGWIKKNSISMNIFVFGIILGSTTLLFIIARLASQYGEKFRIDENRISKIIGGMFVLLALYQGLTIL
jgi:threonine/homoserine/homoserine lactone efflux protein